MTVHARRIVAWRELCEPRRGCRIIFATGTGPISGLARLGRPYQVETKGAFGGRKLLSLCRHLWNPAIGRINNHRCACTAALAGYEQLIVRATNIQFGPALRTLILTIQCRPLRIQCGPLLRGKKFLIRISGWAL